MDFDIFDENKNNKKLHGISSRTILQPDQFMAVLSIPLFRFIISSHSRSVCRESYVRLGISPFKAAHLEKKKKKIINKKFLEFTNYTEENTTLSLSGMKGNGSLPTFKQKTYKYLHFLDLSDVLISSSDIYKRAMNLKQLSILCLHNCGILQIPNELCKLSLTLTTLDLSLNYISNIPNEIHWERLKGINLSSNAFDGWPENLNSTKLPNLTYLDISNNKIINCPSNIGFINLYFLDFSYCALASFPEWILNSKQLKYLSLRGNSHLSLPDLNFISNFNSLKRLDISGLSFEDKITEIHPPAPLEVIVARNHTSEFIPKRNYIIIHD